MAIPGLGAMLQGGFRGSLLLVGPSGCGKSLYARQFLCGTLRSGGTAVYSFTDKSTNRVIEEFAPLGVDLEGYVRSGSFKMVDLHSKLRSASQSTAELGVSNWIRGKSSKIQANESVIQLIEQALEGSTEPNFVFDSLTTLSLSTSEKEAEIFVNELLDKLSSINALSIFVLSSGVHDETFGHLIRSQFDGVLEIKAEESGGRVKRSLRTISLRGGTGDAGWVEFDMPDGGPATTSDVSNRCAWCSKPIIGEPLTFEDLGDIKHFDTRNCLITYRKLKSVYGDAFR